MPNLATERLTLRPLRREDAPDVYAYASDPAATRDVAFDTHTSLADSIAFIEEVTRETGPTRPLVWGITLGDDAPVFGTVGIHNRDRAVGAVVAHVAATPAYGIHTLVARIRAHNKGSIEVAKRCGFEPVDRVESRVYVQDAAVDKGPCVYMRRRLDG